jgi:D-sedoheptulose 7-phosphate isomerase
MGMKTVGLSGKTGGIMDAHCDLLIKIPTSYTAAIQEMHITFGHLFCALLEKELGLV